LGAFIDGPSGAGIPVAMTTAMLVGLGFQPMYAIAICMLANTVTVEFGAIRVSMIAAHQVTGIDLMSIGIIVGRQLPLLSFIIPFWRCVMMAGWKRTAAVLPGILVAGLIFAITHF
jgi:L-lactate permease